MNRISGLIVFLFLLTIPNSIFANVWISVDVPTIYTFSAGENSILSTGSSIKGKPAGTIIHASLPMLPVLGIENYEIGISSPASNDDIATIEVDFINIAYYFSLKPATVLIGYGLGTMKITCASGYCTGYDFESGNASQVYAHLGISLFNEVDFYLSAHWVTCRNDFTYASQDGDLNLTGVLYSFGIKVGW